MLDRERGNVSPDRFTVDDPPSRPIPDGIIGESLVQVQRSRFGRIPSSSLRRCPVPADRGRGDRSLRDGGARRQATRRDATQTDAFLVLEERKSRIGGVRSSQSSRCAPPTCQQFLPADSVPPVASRDPLRFIRTISRPARAREATGCDSGAIDRCSGTILGERLEFEDFSRKSSLLGNTDATVSQLTRKKLDR